jgi:enterochelin esterase family protein
MLRLALVVSLGLLALPSFGHAAPDAGAAAVKPAARRPPLREPQVASPERDADGRVTFRLYAPDAREVRVEGQWTKDKLVMKKDASGVWSVTTGPVAPGVWEYSLVLDGVQMIDPNNPLIKPQRAPRTSILEVPAPTPSVTELQDVPHGTVHVHRYLSKATGQMRRLHVYTPPGYEARPGARYPTLYLFHGFGDNDGAWVVHGRAGFVLDNLIAAKQAAPMVVVMTDGHPVPPGPSFDRPRSGPDNTDVFSQDLLGSVLPLVEATYRVKKDAADRAIVGLSMGGLQSLTVGLNHPDTFAWVGGFSAVAPEEERVATAVAAAPTLNKKLRWLWLAVGRDDFLLDRNKAFVALLEAKGVKHSFQITDGDHSWPVWRRYLAEIAPQLFVAKK